VLREYRQGESDLIERDGVFYLLATCEVPETELYEPDGFVGVDLDIVNIATTSTGYQAAGRQLNRYRKRQPALRAKLQNRISQAKFVCRSCGVGAHADRNASHVIARRGEDVWTAGHESRVPSTHGGAWTEDPPSSPAP
jgi:putative transposase